MNRLRSDFWESVSNPPTVLPEFTTEGEVVMVLAEVKNKREKRNEIIMTVCVNVDNPWGHEIIRWRPLPPTGDYTSD